MTTQSSTGVPADPEEALEHGVFLYGVVAAGREIPDLTGLDSAPITVVQHGAVAAAVSDVALDRPPGRRADLIAYKEAVDLLAAGGVVLPLRFGMVLPDDRAVVEELLGPREPDLVRMLDDLEGRHQFNLRASYVEEAILSEIVQGEPEVRALRERTRDLPEDAAYGDRVRLGELVARSLEARSGEDADSIMEGVLPLVVDYVEHGATGGMEALVDVALLVDDENEAVFVQRLEDLAEALHDRIRLRLVGPLPPFDFVGEM